MVKWKRQLLQDGMVHAKPIGQMDAEAKPYKGESGKGRPCSYTKKEVADICLNCNKPRCTGEERCFKKRKKEATKE